MEHEHAAVGQNRDRNEICSQSQSRQLHAIVRGRWQNQLHHPYQQASSPPPVVMAPMKASAMKTVKSISKGGIADAISGETELKKSDVAKVLGALADLAAKEVKKGKFTIPGVCMIKTRRKPATKAGKREMFGKMCVVKAKPAKTVVKAFAVAALKQAV